MSYDDVQKVVNAAKGKLAVLNDNFGKYFIRAIMAGFFVTMAVILSAVSGNTFASSSPAAGKLLGAVYFSIAVCLLVAVGGELFTGNNMVMAVGSYTKNVAWKDTARIWGISYLGNLVGSIVFSLIFVAAGASGTTPFYEGMIDGKLSIPAGQLFCRGVLCNFFVCLAVLCGIKMKDEVGKILMITFCISGFVFSGFEHCVANMGIYTVAYCLVPGTSLGAIIKCLIISSLGNVVGGAVLLALPLKLMSADK